MDQFAQGILSLVLNRIGVDVNGTPDSGNGGHGVIIEGRHNRIEENLISGNQGHGILVTTPDVPMLNTLVATSLPDPIPDAGTQFNWLDFTEEATVIDVTLQIDLDHTRDSDLTIELIAPDTTTVRLTTKNGGDGDGYDGTIFDDDAHSPITEGTPPFAATFRPEQPLAAFDGLPAKGTWLLWISDDTAGETGLLRDFSLSLTTVNTQGNEIVVNTIGLDAVHENPEPNVGAGVHIEGVGNRVESNHIAGNLAGLPGMSIPCGFDEAGLPVGLQIIGNYFSEAKMLNVAHGYQQQTDWHLRKSPVAAS